MTADDGNATKLRTEGRARWFASIDSILLLHHLGESVAEYRVVCHWSLWWPLREATALSFHVGTLIVWHVRIICDDGWSWCYEKRQAKKLKGTALITGNWYQDCDTVREADLIMYTAARTCLLQTPSTVSRQKAQMFCLQPEHRNPCKARPVNMLSHTAHVVGRTNVRTLEENISERRKCE